MVLRALHVYALRTAHARAGCGKNRVTPDDLKKVGIKLYGRKAWKSHMARALNVDVSTIHRIGHRTIVPGPYEVALTGLLEHKRRQDEIDRAARKLLPRGYKKRHVAPRKPKPKKLVPYAGQESQNPITGESE